MTEKDDAVLMMLIKKGSEGVGVVDFSEHLGIDEQTLSDIIDRLRYGLFESDSDSSIKFDS